MKSHICQKGSLFPQNPETHLPWRNPFVQFTVWLAGNDTCDPRHAQHVSHNPSQQGTSYLEGHGDCHLPASGGSASAPVCPGAVVTLLSPVHPVLVPGALPLLLHFMNPRNQMETDNSQTKGKFQCNQYSTWDTLEELDDLAQVTGEILRRQYFPRDFESWIMLGSKESKGRLSVTWNTQGILS